MGNINALEIDFFKSFADEIQSKFRRISQLVSHPTSTGNYHEEILRVVLRNFLSNRYSVKQGFVYKNTQNKSSQIDIMVIDESVPAAYLFKDGDFAIVMPEAVAAIIEVKTKITKQEFSKAVLNIASAKKLVEYPTITGIIFSYSGTPPQKGWFSQESLKELKDDRKVIPDSIFIFERGYLLNRYDEEKNWKRDGIYYHASSMNNENISNIAWQLSVILAQVINACEELDSRARRTFPEGFAQRLIQSEGNKVDPNKFKFG